MKPFKVGAEYTAIMVKLEKQRYEENKHLIKNPYLSEWINENYTSMIGDGENALCELDFNDMDKFAEWLVEKLK